MRAFVVLGGVVATATGTSNPSSVLATSVKILNEMAQKATKEMNAEKVAWAARAEHCKADTETFSNNVLEGENEIARLNGVIGTQEGIAAQKTKEIAAHQGAIVSSNEAIKAITAQRKDTHKLYMESKLDLEDAILALDQAKRVLANEVKRQKEAGQKEESAEAFLQTPGSVLPNNVKTLVMSLLETKGMKEQAAYESNMGSVIELLDDEQRSARANLNTVEVEEINSRNSDNMVKQTNQNELEQSEKALEEAIASKKGAEAAKAQAEEQLAQANQALAEDTKELHSWVKLCDEETKSFNEKQQVRMDEITAINQAVGILGEASFAKPVELVQTLLQIKDPLADRAASAKVSLFLSRKGRKLNSDVLSLIAEKITDNPFEKVTDMIKDMLDKLIKEQGAEADEKQFCDKNFEENKVNTKRTQVRLDRAAAKFEDASALHAKHSEESERLGKELAALEETMKTTETDRQTEKTANEQEIQTCKDDANAVTNAIGVLREFYDKMEHTTALLQKKQEPEEEFGYGKEVKEGKTKDTGHVDGMATFGDTYAGQTETGTHVMAMLESVVQTVNDKQAEIEKAEADAQKAHDDFMQESKVAKMTKGTAKDNHTTNAANYKTAAMRAEGDVNSYQKDIDLLAKTRNSLMDRCPVWAGGRNGKPSRAMRLQQRQEEIDALRMALDMLQP